jgi:hypothetical protein
VFIRNTNHFPDTYEGKVPKSGMGAQISIEVRIEGHNRSGGAWKGCELGQS